MIKMTVNPQAEPKSFCFNQDIIIIGEGSPESVDICFPSEGLHQNHIKILYKDNAYWVINQANDPFVTLNGHPFGKKCLQAKDLLQIRNHIMAIDEITSHTLYESFTPPEPVQEPISIPDPQNLDHSENPESWFVKGPPPSTSKISPMQPFHTINPLLEEAYNLEEQKQPLRSSRPLAKSKPHSLKKKIIKFTVLACLLVAGILGLTFTELYFRAASKSSKEEMRAASTLADYAMALAYAKTAHAGAQNTSWIDPHFIKNYLADLIPSSLSPCASIDAHGQFSDCPYMLRYYMNRDFTRFLLIAQPSPRLMQWFLPQKVLIVDSNLMEVRKTDDLRALNRLLSDASPLEGAIGDEVTKAVLQTEIIPLDAIASATKRREFSPPTALKYMKPGAENLIYNAPRYYQFASPFIKKALNAFQTKEIALLQNDMNALSPYHDLIFYSKDGLQDALIASQALYKLKSPLSFFTAYLIFSKQGAILKSHLLINNEPEEEEEISSEKPAALEEPAKPFSKPPGAEDILATVLKEKGEHAQEIINPILQNLYTVLENAIEKDSIFLPPVFFQLFDQYKEKQKRIWSDIQNTVAGMKTSHPQVSESTYERLLREYGLLDTYALPHQGDIVPISSPPQLGWVELIADMGQGVKKGKSAKPPFLE